MRKAASKMEKILAGIDGSERGDKALMWAARLAQGEQARLTLMTVVDRAFLRDAGTDEAYAEACVHDMLQISVAWVHAEYPELECATGIEFGKPIDALAKAANDHDLVVVGSHHGRSIGKTVGGASGLRIAMSTKTPCVVVPADWDAAQEGEGILVAVGPEQRGDEAIEFGLKRARELGVPLRLVSAWGLPPYLTRPAEVMGGGLQPVGAAFQQRLDEYVSSIKKRYPDVRVAGEAIEGSSPTKVLLEEGKGSAVLVMGTYAHTALGRAVFGSVTHSVLLNLTVPTVLVPLK